MSTEKTEAIVIRLADFSESSHVVTLFTEEFGKVSALAKGAKRLRNPFESALDLLSVCQIVFLLKSTSGLDLLTEAKLVQRFQPQSGSLSHLYGGYYVAELLAGLTENHDPHPALYRRTRTVLELLAGEGDPRLPLLQFELAVLQEIGQLPNFETCQACGEEIVFEEKVRYWVSQGGLICSQCARPEYAESAMQPGTIAIANRLLAASPQALARTNVSKTQMRELRRLVTSAVSHALGRRPKMLALIRF